MLKVKEEHLKKKIQNAIDEKLHFNNEQQQSETTENQYLKTEEKIQIKKKKIIDPDDLSPVLY